MSERDRIRSKLWRINNPERFKAAKDDWRERNRERDAATKKAWAIKNAEKIREYQKRWREENAEHLRRYKKQRRPFIRVRQNEWKWADPSRVVAHNCREAIRRVLKCGNLRKSDSVLKIIGCDIQWLMAWLEVHFRPGMNWENYGPVWHIDHRRPCASFDLTDPQQQRQCFHWTNLQPLFAGENLSKHSTWEEVA